MILYAHPKIPNINKSTSYLKVFASQIKYKVSSKADEPELWSSAYHESAYQLIMSQQRWGRKGSR